MVVVVDDERMADQRLRSFFSFSSLPHHASAQTQRQSIRNSGANSLVGRFRLGCRIVIFFSFGYPLMRISSFYLSVFFLSFSFHLLLHSTILILRASTEIKKQKNQFPPQKTEDMNGQFIRNTKLK